MPMASAQVSARSHTNAEMGDLSFIVGVLSILFWFEPLENGWDISSLRSAMQEIADTYEFLN